MKSNESRPVDPMFTLHRGRAQVPAYQRRSGGLDFKDIMLLNQPSEHEHSSVGLQPLPQPQKMSPQHVSRQTASAAAHHRRHMHAERSMVYQPPTEAGVGNKRHRHTALSFRQTWLLYGMATMVFVVGITVSVAGLRTNHEVAKQVKQVQKKAGSASANSDAVIPSTTKPTSNEVQQYVVSPNLPRYIDIAKLSVHARIFSEGVDRRGQLQVPWNIYDTGWYNASAQPGQPGAMLVDGHSGINNVHGVFYKLASLAAGDLIVVTRGDETKVTYSVVKVQTVDVKNVDMASMLVSVDTAKPGLNLITCAGDQIPGTTELNKRVQVYAIQQ